MNIVYLLPANEVCEGYVFIGVCLSTWAVCLWPAGCLLHTPGRHPLCRHPMGRQPPPGETPPRQTPPIWADSHHPGQTPPSWADTPLLGRHPPPGQTPPSWQTPLDRHPRQTALWADNPLLGRHLPLGRHPLLCRRPSGQTPQPPAQTPLPYGILRIRSTSGRYASYWNAFFLDLLMDR